MFDLPLSGLLLTHKTPPDCQFHSSGAQKFFGPQPNFSKWEPSTETPGWGSDSVPSLRTGVHVMVSDTFFHSTAGVRTSPLDFQFHPRAKLRYSRPKLVLIKLKLSTGYDLSTAIRLLLFLHCTVWLRSHFHKVRTNHRDTGLRLWSIPSWLTAVKHLILLKRSHGALHSDSGGQLCLSLLQLTGLSVTDRNATSSRTLKCPSSGPSVALASAITERNVQHRHFSCGFVLLQSPCAALQPQK